MMKSSERNRTDRLYNYFYKYGLYIVLVVLAVTFGTLNANFFTINNLINILQQSSAAGIAAAGLVFVILTAGIDISMGSTIYFSSVIVTIATNAGVGLFGAIILALACGAAVGVINGFFIAKLNVVPLIVTLANLYLVRGVALVITDLHTMFFSNSVADAIAYTRLFGVFPVVILILIVTLVLVQITLSKTMFGRQLYAIGNNKIGALKIGIKVERNVFLAYVICGMMAGLSGLISGAQVGGITPTFAVGQEFIIISATVLGGVSLFGGKGKAFPGAFIGVLIVMCIENGLVMARANMYLYTIVRGIVIFLAVMLDCMRNKSELR